MHPAIAVRKLTGLSKALAGILSDVPDGMSQVAIMKRLPNAPSQSTVSRALQAMTNGSIVIKSGTTKDSVFRLDPRAAIFARDASRRPPVPYDFARVADYQPNVTRWLAPETEVKMRAAAAVANSKLDASTYSRQIAGRFLIDLSWASSALEGNTYTYLETEALLKYGEQAEDKDVFEATMILNHKKAIVLLLDNLDTSIEDSRIVARLHTIVMRGLISTEDLGRVRAEQVTIGASAYQPLSDRTLLEMEFGALCWKAAQIQNPFEASFFLMMAIAYLQPFVDGNKRAGRLSCNIPLLHEGLPPMSFVGLDKADYMTALLLFYETADTSLMADIVSDAYVRMAPTYAASAAIHRRPRSVELREQTRIDQLVHAVIYQTVEGIAFDRDALFNELFQHLGDEDRMAVRDAVMDILQGINDINCVAWNIPPEEAARYREIRDAETEPGQLGPVKK